MAPLANGSLQMTAHFTPSPIPLSPCSVLDMHSSPRKQRPHTVDLNEPEDASLSKAESSSSSDRRASVRSTSEASGPLERRRSSLWDGTDTEGYGRRGSTLLSKRSGEFGGWSKGPPSPANRRASLAASIHPPASSSSSPASQHHRKGRRPSSSSSAMSSATIRPVGDGSPTNSSSLLPFGHQSKNSARRRSSLNRIMPLSSPPLINTTNINVPSSTSTASSIQSYHLPHHHTSHSSTRPSPPSSMSLRANFLLPPSDPGAELQAYRFGASSPSQPHVSSNGHNRADENIAPDAVVEDEAAADRARQRFREQLMQAGISSIKILLPPPVVGGTRSPLNSPRSPMKSSRSARRPNHPLLSPPIPTPGSRASRRRPSEQFYNASPTSSIRNERLGPWSNDEGELRDSSDEEGFDYFANHRNSVADNADDEESGLEDETENGGHQEQRQKEERRDERVAESEAATVAATAWRTPHFRNPFDAPTPLADLKTPSSLSYMTPGSPSLSENSSSLHIPPISISSSSSTTPTSIPNKDNDFLFHSTPSVPSSPSYARRPSLATSQKSLTRIFAASNLPQTHPCPDSPARSVSDSAVPRRPSLAAEIGLDEPGAGPSSVAGHEEVEWDLNFVLGRSGSESGYSAFGEEDPMGRGGEFGMPDMGKPLRPDELDVDTFAQFVQANDPQFDRLRLAWTLTRSNSTSNVWSLPSSGGYTFYPSSTLPSFTSDSPPYPRDSISRLERAGSSSSDFPSLSPYSIVCTNSDRSLSWALKPRGKGWAIIPLAGEGVSRDEIRFGPKGKWRSRDAREGSGSSVTSAKQRSSRESSKDGESIMKGKRQMGRRLSSKERIGMANAAFNGASSPLDELSERGTPSSPLQLSSAESHPSPKTGAKTLSPIASTTSDHLIARTNSPSRLNPSVLGSYSTSPSNGGLMDGSKSSLLKSTKRDKSEKEKKEEKKEKEGLGAKIKKKGGWFSSLKHATNLSSSSTNVRTQSAPGSAALSITSGSVSGNDDLPSPPPRISFDRPTATYVPPWMTSSNPNDTKSSSSGGVQGFASKIKLKRRSLSDGTKKSTKRSGAGNISGNDDAAFSVGSKRRSGVGGMPQESDNETGDGEERQGIAWEDVPVEALAMVIPLRIRGSTDPSTLPRKYGSNSTGNSGLLANDSRRSSDFAFLDGQWSQLDSLNSPQQGAGHFPTASLVSPPAENSLLVYFVPFGHSNDPGPSGEAYRALCPSLASTTSTTNPLRFIKTAKLRKTSSQIFHRSSKDTTSSQVATSSNTRLNAVSHSTNPPLRTSVPSSQAIPTSPPWSTSRPSIEPTQYSSNFSGNSNQSSLFSSSSGLSSSPPNPPPPPALTRASFTRNSQSTSISALSSPRARFARFAPFPSSSPNPNHNPSFSSFRIVARIVDPSDLTFLPSWPSWESQPFATTVPQGLGQTVDISLSGPGTNPETKAKETRDSRTDPTVVGVCHGARTGVEFVREGWERLGFLQSRNEEDSGFGEPNQPEGGLKENGLDEVLGVVVTAVIAILT